MLQVKISVKVAAEERLEEIEEVMRSIEPAARKEDPTLTRACEEFLIHLMENFLPENKDQNRSREEISKISKGEKPSRHCLPQTFAIWMVKQALVVKKVPINVLFARNQKEFLDQFSPYLVVA